MGGPSFGNSKPLRQPKRRGPWEGNQKPFKSLLRERLGDQQPSGAVFLTTHPPFFAPRAFPCACCSVTLQSDKTAWRLHVLMLFPMSGAGFWCGRCVLATRFLLH